MKAYSYYVLFLLVVFLWNCSRPTELTSPDGNIKLVFNLNGGGRDDLQVSVGEIQFLHHPLPLLGFEGQ